MEKNYNDKLEFVNQEHTEHEKIRDSSSSSSDGSNETQQSQENPEQNIAQSTTLLQRYVSLTRDSTSVVYEANYRNMCSNTDTSTRCVCMHWSNCSYF